MSTGTGIPRPEDYDGAILVVGVTGSGKSTLINKMCGHNKLGISSGLESCTKRVQWAIEGRWLFIDTPGFDHSEMCLEEILEQIAHFVLKIQAHRGFVSSSVVLLLDDGSLNERTAWFNQICDFMAGLAWEKELHWKIIVAIGKANGGDEGALGRVQQVLQPIIHKSHFYDKALNTRSQLVEFLRWVPKVQGYRQPLDLTRELSLLRIRLRAKHSLKWLLYLWVSTNVSCKGRVSH